LAVGGDEGVVDEQEVGDESEFGEGLSDRLLDAVERV
jgi:hypothetical protein